MFVQYGNLMVGKNCDYIKLNNIYNSSFLSNECSYNFFFFFCHFNTL